jgi:glutamine amidotransferase
LEERPEVDLSGVVAETRSDVLIGHVRAPTVGALVADNTHPFRFRHWLFAHDGTITPFEAVQEQMVHAMPSFLGRSMAGGTDSECFFHLVLAFLHDARQLGNPQLGPQPVREALIKAVTMVDELASQQGGESASPMNVLLTNGAYIMALHRSPIELRYMTYTAPGREKIRPRAVLVACEKSSAGGKWEAMPANSILTVGHDMTVDISEF